MMTTIAITFLFKCRQCGQIQRGFSLGTNDDGIHTNARKRLIDAIMGQVNKEEPMAPGMFDMHTCGPGKVGIADLIGFEPEP